MAEGDLLPRKKRVGILVELAIFALLCGGGYLIGTGKVFQGSPRCEVCKRQLHHGAAFWVAAADGSKRRTCCPRCGLHLVRIQGGKAVEAMDFQSGKTIPADKAVYLEGSDIMECCSTTGMRTDEGTLQDVHYDRCMPSLLAFSKTADAESIRQKHGGRIISFDVAKQSVAKQ
jgi:hypothetical protein